MLTGGSASLHLCSAVHLTGRDLHRYQGMRFTGCPMTYSSSGETRWCWCRLGEKLLLASPSSQMRGSPTVAQSTEAHMLQALTTSAQKLSIRVPQPDLS